MSLFSPLEIGKVRFKNRISSTAHGENLADSGLLTDRLARYHVRRAEGGVGLIVAFGSASVDPRAAYPTSVALWNPANEQALRQLATDVHAHGTVLLAQATHRGVRENPSEPNGVLFGPSALNGGPPMGAAHVLAQQEIDGIVRCFATAASVLAKCGWDGIEITSFGTHLIEQFWSPKLNRREDRYGGSLVNRMRFGIEVIEAVASSVPADFIVAFRMTADPMTDELGLGPADMLEIAERMDGLGRIDLFDISGGSGMSPATHAASVPTDTFPRSCYNHLARAVRARVSVPVLLAGRILDLDEAESAVAAGDCDLVGMTRALIADPDLPKAQTKGATPPRPCIAINEGCRRVVNGLSLACTVNPAVAEPSLEHLATAAYAKKVVIVGGGPAGMEAARVAAERGHEVVLYEREERLGGCVAIAARAPNRPSLLRHIEWCERRLSALGVDLRMNSESSASDIAREDADLVVLATGAEDVVPDEAKELNVAVTDVDLLTATVQPAEGMHVVVYDQEGHGRGATAALLARACRADVHLVTPGTAPCDKLEPPNRPATLRELAASEIQVLTSYRFKEVHTDEICFTELWTGAERRIRADFVVFVGFRSARTALADAMEDVLPDIPKVVIGDCYAPRMLRHAIADGVRVGATI